MSRIHGYDTQPELILRRFLRSHRFRFELHRDDLPGKPDVVLTRHRAVIFVHGCFWHGHRCKGGRRPRSNVDYWHAKLDKNKKRDSQNARQLRRLGWKRVVVWACQLKDLDRLYTRLINLLES